jgi:monoamine oxidase
MHDVVIIGAGFCGLSAATALIDAGADVVVLEARDRVGGRVESKIMADGLRIDTGGQFLCEDMPEIWGLAQRFGKTPVHAYAEGGITFRPYLPPETGYAQWDEIETLRQRIRTIDLGDPSLAALTVADWIARQDATPAGKDGFIRLVEGLWCKAAEDIAFVYLASNDRRNTNEQSEMEFFLAETMHALAEDMAAALSPRVRLGTPARTISHRADGVEIDCGSKKLAARHVIIATPPVMARRLAYEPALPAVLTGALDAWGSGTVTKLLIRYRQPFWRARGLSGTVVWNHPHGLYACDASQGSKAAIVVFIGGPSAEEWHGRDPLELQRFVVEELAGALGSEAGDPVEISLRDWVDDAWSGGAYSDAITDVNRTDAEDLLRAGLPRLHFACSELSPSFPGYIEGAIVAGRAAAANVLARLHTG